MKRFPNFGDLEFGAADIMQQGQEVALSDVPLGIQRMAVEDDRREAPVRAFSGRSGSRSLLPPPSRKRHVWVPVWHMRIILLCTASMLAAAVASLAWSLTRASSEGAELSGGDAGGCAASADDNSTSLPMALAGLSAATAADHPHCSRMGVEQLRAGGNAVDAAVSVALCLGVLRPFASGLGGGAFILVRMHNASSVVEEVIDAREEAPAEASERMFVGRPGASLRGGLAVAVPGELAGLHLAWRRHGRLAWRALVSPAAELAESFVVDAQLAHSISNNLNALHSFPSSAAIFLPRGVQSPPQAGERLANPQLAATLRAIADRGPAALTTGPIAEQIVAAVRAAGGNMSVADLQAYAPIVREPLRARLGGLTYLAAPPPSSGGATVLQALRYLSLGETPLASASAALAAHRTVEALKHAFALRMSLGDPTFVSNASRVVEAMLSEEFNAALHAAHSDASTRPLGEYGGEYSVHTGLPADGGTSHFSIVDSERNAVALTTTINTGFGSKVSAAGLVLNNEMDDFSTPGEPNTYGLAPSAANFVAPRKRPLSSMSPTIVLAPALTPRAEPTVALRAVVGASGGPRIISAVLQVLLNSLVRGKTAAEAVGAPRLHHQLIPNVVRAEDWTMLDGGSEVVDEAVVAGLRLRGHVVEEWSKHAATQAVMEDTDTRALTAVSDRRKGGLPAGF